MKFQEILILVKIIFVSLHCLYHGKEPTEVSNAEPVNQRFFFVSTHFGPSLILSIELSAT